MLNVIMLNVIMLNVIMLNVIMLNVIMLSVVAPFYIEKLMSKKVNLMACTIKLFKVVTSTTVV